MKKRRRKNRAELQLSFECTLARLNVHWDWLDAWWWSLLWTFSDPIVTFTVLAGVYWSVYVNHNQIEAMLWQVPTTDGHIEPMNFLHMTSCCYFYNLEINVSTAPSDSFKCRRSRNIATVDWVHTGKMFWHMHVNLGFDSQSTDWVHIYYFWFFSQYIHLDALWRVLSPCYWLDSIVLIPCYQLDSNDVLIFIQYLWLDAFWPNIGLLQLIMNSNRHQMGQNLSIWSKQDWNISNQWWTKI